MARRRIGKVNTLRWVIAAVAVVAACLFCILGASLALAAVGDAPSSATAVPGVDPVIALISWAACTPTPDHYEVSVATSASGPFAYVASSTNTTMAYSGGLGGVAYYFQVVAVYAGGINSNPVFCGPVTAPWVASPHRTVAGASLCALCHTPHVSQTTYLGRAELTTSAPEATALCIGCHDGRSPTVANIVTGTVDSFSLPSGHSLEPSGTTLVKDCASCHAAHGKSDVRSMVPASLINSVTVTAAGTAWCEACHDSAYSWYGPGYPSMSAPVRDSHGYPVSGTWPGPVTYASATNAHRLLPETTVTVEASATAGRSAGDCLYCHAAHRGPNTYDALKATFRPPSASTLATDQSSGAYAALCFTCHSSVTPSGFTTPSIDIKQFATGSSDGAGHRIVTAGGTLPVGSPLPCYDCHNPHGSTRDNASMLSDALGGSLETSTDAGVRHTCLSCHTTSDDGFGWNSIGSVYGSVGSAKVEGIARTAGVLRLPSVAGHRTGDLQSCYVCHGNDYSAGGSNVHAPSPNPYPAALHMLAPAATTYSINGVSYGPYACSTCHSVELAAEHAKPTSAGSGLGCSVCHPSPRDTITTLDPTTCVQGGCHTPSSPAPKHGSIDAAHTPGAIDAGCTTGLGCHTGDYATIHVDATTTVNATTTVSSCGVCHATGVPTAGCTGCHGAAPHSTDLTAIHQATATSGTVTIYSAAAGHAQMTFGQPASVEADCTLCHTAMNLTRIHINDCVACHGAGKPASPLLGTWNGTCSQGGCHPTYHTGADAGHKAEYDLANCETCHDYIPGPASANWCGQCHTLADDSKPPTTTSNAGTSYIGTATINFTAVDNVGGSGVASTYYRLDGGAQVTSRTVVVAPPVSGTATHTLLFWSVDNAGNVETAHTATFTVTAYAVDATPPTTASNVTSSYTGTATIALVATDNVGGRGVAATYYRVDGGATLAGTTIVVGPPASFSATHTIQFWSVDLAGNTEVAQSATFTVNAIPDTTPPVTTSDAIANYDGTATVHLSATDNVGGWGVASTHYSLDGGPDLVGTTVTVSPPVSGSSAHVLQFWSFDKAGNRELTKTAAFTVTTNSYAYLGFRWAPDTYTEVGLRVIDASGTVVASVQKSGDTQAELDWNVKVKVGRRYTMFVDYWRTYDEYGNQTDGGGGYGYALTPTIVDHTYEWWY